MARTDGKLFARVTLPWWTGLYMAACRLLAWAGVQFDPDAVVRPLTKRMKVRGPYVVPYDKGN